MKPQYRRAQHAVRWIESVRSAVSKAQPRPLLKSMALFHLISTQGRTIETEAAGSADENRRRMLHKSSNFRHTENLRCIILIGSYPSDPPSGRRHSPDPFSMSLPHCANIPHHDSNLYRFSVTREENHCRWRLPLWLLLFGGTVSVLTLSFLLTGTVYPNSWTRFSPESLGMLTATEGFHRAGHQPPTIENAASSMLKPVSHAVPERIFARISRSGDITMAPRSIRRPSSCGPATLVDNTASLLVQVPMPRDTPRGARCAVTSGFTLARRLEAAGKAARVQVWSLAQTTSDADTWSTTNWDTRPRREAHLSNFDVQPGGGLLLHSAEFGCPPTSQSVQMFEVSCAGGDDDDDDDDACSVDVWQDLFRVEIRA